MSQNFNSSIDNFVNKIGAGEETKEVISDEVQSILASNLSPKEKVNKVFKKIATKTHPDKNIGNDDSDRLVELYKEAQQSVEKKDWSRVTQIARELEIDVTDVEENDSVFLEKSINNMESKIGEIKQTFAWLWVHSEKENRPQLKKHILDVIGVKEKENGDS